MLTQFQNHSVTPKDIVPTVKPTIYLLAGTSSSGKSTTAQSLKKSLEDTSQTEVEIYSYDDFCDLHNDAFMAFLDICVQEAGFDGGLSHAIENKAKLSASEIEKLENCVEEEGTPWMQQKLADAVTIAVKAGKSVIIDTLNTHDIVNRIKKGDAPVDSNIINILLTVPLVSFPERVRARNMNAIKAYRKDFTSKAYKNCREPFDMIEQYLQFYKFESSAGINSITTSDVTKALESAYDDSIQLYLEMAKAHRAYLEILQHETNKDIKKIKSLQHKIKNLNSEADDLKASRSNALKKLLANFIGDSQVTPIRMLPKECYDLIVDTHVTPTTQVIESILKSVKSTNLRISK